MPPLVETRNAKANVDLSTFSLQTQKDGISKEKKGRMVVHMHVFLSQGLLRPHSGSTH